MTAPAVLVVNSGSSSLKFAAYPRFNAAEAEPLPLWQGRIERIGLPGTMFTCGAERHALPQADRRAAVDWFADWLLRRPDHQTLRGVGHRVVFGGPERFAPTRIDASLVLELRRWAAFAPEHLPAEIDAIETLQARLPGVAHVACFDTGFHRDLPDVARRLPLPAALHDAGIRRYGFHGLSFTYLMEELGRRAPAQASGRVILAHLGNGASLAAVQGGRCIDTTMGCTPAAGVVMATRCGDLDPGIVRLLATQHGMNDMAFDRLVHHQAGMLGVSGRSGDVRDLLAVEADDAAAALALALFCQSIRKAIGALAAVLGGLDALVFTGGIGEHAAVLRARISAGLGFLGIELDAAANAAHAPQLQRPGAAVAVHLVRTDEQVVIARAVAALLADEWV